MNKQYFIFTLGCQMNIADSQRISSRLEQLGYKSAPEKEADLVVVNACSVRQHAVDRIWGKIKKWQSQNKKILLTGCVLKEDQKKFSLKNIIYFAIKDLPKLNLILSNYHVIQYDSKITEYFDILPKMEKSSKNRLAYIPIMTGCNNFCSYCAVPYTRGPEKSRPLKDILKEVNDALRIGFCEILLLGQNVNSYKINQKSKVKSLNNNTKSKINNSGFIKLLKTIDNLPENFSFNFMSSNPHDMGDELIVCFSKLKKWPGVLHLAMQSGDDEILKKMNRKYTTIQFLKLVEKLKTEIANIKLSTDIIVGFPGESEKQFNNTVKICKKIGFTKAYISQYSERPGTASAKIIDDVSQNDKKRRWEILNKLINQ